MDFDLEIAQKKIVDDLQNFCGALKKFEQERMKYQNRVERILYHGTNVEPIAKILTNVYKK